MNTTRNKGRVEIAIMMLIAMGSVLLVHFYSPFNSPFYPKCIFKWLTSFDCPGCGGFRSTYCLMHGQIMQALDFNALFLFFIPVLCVGFIAMYTKYLHTIWSVLNKPKLYLILIITFWIVRNINYYPFMVLHSDK